MTLDLMRLVTIDKKIEKIKIFKDIFFNLINKNKSINNITLILSSILILKKSK